MDWQTCWFTDDSPPRRNRTCISEFPAPRPGCSQRLPPIAGPSDERNIALVPATGPGDRPGCRCSCEGAPAQPDQASGFPGRAGAPRCARLRVDGGCPFGPPARRGGVRRRPWRRRGRRVGLSPGRDRRDGPELFRRRRRNQRAGRVTGCHAGSGPSGDGQRPGPAARRRPYARRIPVREFPPRSRHDGGPTGSVAGGRT